MKIPVEDIPEGISKLELVCEIEDIDLVSEGVHFVSPISIKLDLFRQNDKIYVKAEFSVGAESECVRCLSPVHWILESSSENQYRPFPKVVRFPLDDIGIKYYSEEHLDLSEDIRESLLLEIPVRILCSEGCEGLCPHCGKNLNEEKCDCNQKPEETQVSKFADLVKTLKIKGKLEV